MLFYRAPAPAPSSQFLLSLKTRTRSLITKEAPWPWPVPKPSFPLPFHPSGQRTDFLKVQGKSSSFPVTPRALGMWGSAVTATAPLSSNSIPWQLLVSLPQMPTSNSVASATRHAPVPHICQTSQPSVERTPRVRPCRRHRAQGTGMKRTAPASVS